jgi:hypothetical protein
VEWIQLVLLDNTGKFTKFALEMAKILHNCKGNPSENRKSFLVTHALISLQDWNPGHFRDPEWIIPAPDGKKVTQLDLPRKF